MGVIPVKANDVFFPLHAVFACAVTIVQCCIYEVGDSETYFRKATKKTDKMGLKDK